MFPVLKTFIVHPSYFILILKNFGAIIDRTLKVIKLNYLKAFKDAGVDITTEQWVLMDSLYQENGVSQNDLASDSFKNAPTVSRIIDLMVKKGFVERKRFENDRRRYRISLTTKGKKAHEKVMPKVMELREQGWDGLTDDDYAHLTRILDRVFQNFE